MLHIQPYPRRAGPAEPLPPLGLLLPLEAIFLGSFLCIPVEDNLNRLCQSAKDGCVRTCFNVLAFAPRYIADLFYGMNMSYISFPSSS